MHTQTGRIAFFALIVVVAEIAQTEQLNLPLEMSFIGLQDNGWRLYTIVSSDSMLKQIPTILEPRTQTVNAQTRKVAYIGPDASLIEISIDDRTERTVLSAGNDYAYAQPTYDAQGKTLFVVALKKGASVDTDILMRKDGEWSVLIKQRSAQFEPYFHPPNTLYYSNVHCTEDCGHIIQEIWRKDLVSGVSEQVTLVNAIARQPVVSSDGKWLYFSSNKAGNFHIWRLSLESSEYERLTDGNVTDESPALDASDRLFFVRHSRDEPTEILMWEKDGALTVLPLPKEIEGIRDLEISR